MASRSLNPQKMKDFAKKKIFNQKTKFKYIVSLRRHIWTASKQRNDCILFFGCVKFRQTARHCLNDEFPIFWWNSAWVVWCIKCGWHFCAAQPFFPPAVHKTSVCNQTMQKIMPVGGQKMDRQTDRQTEKGWRRMTYSESLTTLNLFISLQFQNLSYRRKKILSKIMTFGDSAESGRNDWSNSKKWLQCQNQNDWWEVKFVAKHFVGN
jgi:hypothetical protein